MIAVDIFRIANGKIAEHWDYEVPAAQSANHRHEASPGFLGLAQWLRSERHENCYNQGV
jgi:hypothetical protein